MQPIRILHLEDNPLDAELIEAELAAQKIPASIRHVETRQDYLAALESGNVDLVLSDHGLPMFDGSQALRLTRELKPQLPFIFVTGSLGEEKAIQTFKEGATDYVLKHRLERLGPAIHRAMREAADRQARKTAEECNAEQARLLDLSPDAIITCGLDGVIRFWSDGAEKLYGQPRASVAEKKVSEVVCEDEAVFAELSALALEHGSWHRELQHRHASGRKLLVSSRGAVLRGGADQPRLILIINTDVTEKKQLEEQFLRAQRLESLGALAGGIAHDLNNVLAPILMGLDLLKVGVATSDDRQLLSTLESTAQRGAGMVKQILSFARGSPDERRPVQVNHLISDIFSVCRSTFPASIRVKRQIAADLWPAVIDATQMYQVFMNLCVNARDAMPEGGMLEITTENIVMDSAGIPEGADSKPGHYIAITVRDTGTGMPPEILAKIFDPFFTTKEPGKGTGLGLSTSMSIVKNHEGFMLVTSEPGRGTRFKVHIPARFEDEVLEAVQTKREELRGNGEGVLVVDDEESVRAITRETLQNYGYKVFAARDGTEAIGIYAQHRDKISVVMTDMAMPFMDGPATIRALRNMNPGLRMLAVSGTVELGSIPALEDFSALAYLQKPFTAQALLARISDLIHSSPPEPPA